MRKSFFVVFLFLAFAQWASAQNLNVWSTLSMIEVKSEFNADYGYETQKISVSPIVQSMENTEIEVEGYIIPLTGKVKQSHFMLSSLPANMCFFCGKAGPETAMQIFMKNNTKVAFSENKIRVKGKLLVNPNSENKILYTLENAELLN